MDTETLRGELERAFELEGLTELSRDILGLSPEEVGGTSSKAAFARALVERCRELDAIEALCDAAQASKGFFEPKVLEHLSRAPAPTELHAGDALGPWTIVRKLGSGPCATVYVAKRDGQERALKVLHAEASAQRRGLARFSAACRLVGRIKHEGVPAGMEIETIDGQTLVSYEHVDGQTMAARTARSGPMHLNEARAILRGILESLAVYHERRVVHGNLKLENVLTCRGEAGKPRIILLDPAFDRLRLLKGPASDGQDLFVVLGAARAMAPEQVRGDWLDPRIDVYAFGALMYEILTGKPLYPARSGFEFAVAHLSSTPADPVTAGPRGWVTKEVGAFITRLLSKDATARPKDARVLLEEFEKFGRAGEAAKKAEPKITEEQLAKCIDSLVVAPDDEAAAAALDAAVEDGADPAKVAQAFTVAADQIEGDEPEKIETRKALLFRAARLYESNLKNLEEAEKAYSWIVELDASDDLASAALENVRKQLGKYEEVIEMLLGRVELSEDGAARAEAMAEIGRIYAEELDDKAQAVVAYAKAFSEAPSHGEYADAIDTHVGSDVQALGDAIAMLAEATRSELPVDQKNLLFLRLAGWYLTKLARPDAALPCYQAVIATDTNNEAALEGMASLFRTTQQYTELGQVLLRRADAATNPAKARDHRAEAAELLETRLNEPAKARELYEQVIEADPGHLKAGDALLRIYDKEKNSRGILRILERRAEALRGPERCDALVRIAGIYEELKEYSESVKRYEQALVADDTNLKALTSLEQIFIKSSKFQELLGNLERQAALASTPRQKIAFFERIAKIWEDEFLDHDKAAKALEAILEIDPAHEAALDGLGKHYRALNRWEDVAGVYERQLKLTTEKTRRLEILLLRARVLSDHVGAPDRAIKVYEEVLEIEPGHSGALETVAMLREQAGDAAAALKAIEALAEKAATPRDRGDHYVRAAKMLESRGDLDGAVSRYKMALDANPKESSASNALRAIYADRGEAGAAIELLLKEIEFADVASSKAKLAAEIARLAREKLKDNARAETAAKDALRYDATQIDALVLLGDLAYEAERFIEAAHHLESVVTRIDVLPKEQGGRSLRRYVDSLARTGSSEKALAHCDKLLELSPGDLDSMQAAAKVFFDHGDPKRALQLYSTILEEAGSRLVGSDRSTVLFRHGEAARRAGDAVTALKSLSEAADMDPSAPEPLAAIAKVHETKGDWEEVIRIKSRRLDVASGDERVDLLVEIGEVCASKLNDRTRAAKSFATALEERPEDRKLLTRLMQVYSENKDWQKLVEIVLKLADFVDDKKQKAKYVHTAAMVTAQQMNEPDKALEFLDKVLELDPSNDKALDEALKLRRDKEDFEGVDKMLKVRLERATERSDRDTILRTFDELGELYHKKLNLMNEAVDAYEAAQMLDPENPSRNELLASMYASNPAQYLDKAVVAHRALMKQNAGRAESYKLLRKLYTEAKRADGAWCMCQALTVLGFAEPDEERFYRRMRAEGAAPAKDCLVDDDWIKLLMHENADPILTAILALIEPAILATRADTLENLGYDQRYAIELSMHPYPISQTIYYAAGVLGMQAPPTFQNINDQGGINFLHAQIPSIVLGRAAFEIELPQQQAAFMVARHLCYYRPGMYVRHLVPTGTGLKAWVFAAIKMNAPQFPISADLEGPVAENLKALTAHLSGSIRERLASLVSKLLQGGGSLDLKRWIAAVDLTADRAGLLVAHDLEVAMDMVKISDETASPVSHKDRLKELVLYSVSEEYFGLRRKLQIGIDS